MDMTVSGPSHVIHHSTTNPGDRHTDALLRSESNLTDISCPTLQIFRNGAKVRPDTI